jgi:hypothetical protein
MSFTLKEKKLIRLALSGTKKGESQTAWLKLLNSLKNRQLSGYDLEQFRSDVSPQFDATAYFGILGRKMRGTKAAHERAKRAAQARWGKK